MLDRLLSPASLSNGSGETRQVLHVITSDAFAGIERHVINLTRELRALGCLAAIACPPSATRLRAEAIAIGVPVAPPAECRQRWWLATLILDILADPPDVVHVHDGRSAIVGALLSVSVPGLLIRTQHFTHPASVERDGFRGLINRQTHRCLNRRLDGYVAVSQAVADAARGRDETRRAEVVVIPPAIELANHRACSAARQTRAQISRPTVIFAGRLEAERRLEVLLRAVPMVLEAMPDCHFVLLGSGAHEGALRGLATQLGLASAITWGGWAEDPYDAMTRAHVYVNTWPREGFGMAMAEAMSLALPVIAIDAGASSEIIENGVTGRLVPPDDPAALGAAIVQLLTDRHQLDEMGARARHRATTLYGASRTALATHAFYRRLEAKATS